MNDSAWSVPAAQLSSGLPTELSVVFVLAFMFALGVALLMSIVRFRMHRRALRRALAAARGADVLRPGRTIVFGRVETSDGKPAMQVRITQSGWETQRRNRYSHTWQEIDRQVEVRPFKLRTRKGELVRVELHDCVRLVDAIRVVKHSQRHERTQAVELSHGEDAYVEGVLENEHDPDSSSVDYRGAGRSWIIRAPQEEATLVSTLPLDKPHRKWSLFWGGTTVVVAFVFVLSSLVSYVTFWEPYFEGVVVSARVTSLDIERTGSYRHRSARFIVRATATMPDGTMLPLHRSVEGEIWSKLSVGDSVPFRIVPSSPASAQLGTQTRISSLGCLMSLAFLGFVGAMLFLLFRHLHDWYEVSHWVERKGGRLPEPTTLLDA